MKNKYHETSGFLVLEFGFWIIPVSREGGGEKKEPSNVDADE